MTSRTPVAPSRGTFVPLARPRTSTVPAHYLQLRRMSITAVHQQDLNRFAGSMKDAYGGEEEAMWAYFSNFKQQVDRSQAAYIMRKAEIMNDAGATLMEKHKAIERIGQPMMPSWSEAAEGAYIRTYGDPRSNVVLWDQAIAHLKLPEVPMQKNMRSTLYQRTPWELFVINNLLADPSIDGSVAPCLVFGAISAARSHPAAVARDNFIPPAAVAMEDMDPAYYAAMVKIASTVCPHCLESYPRNMAQHEQSCAKRHGKESILRILPAMRLRMEEGAQSDAPDAEDDEDGETGDTDAQDGPEGGSQPPE